MRSFIRVSCGFMQVRGRAPPSGCVIVATSFSLPSSMAKARPSTTVMVRPGLMTRPSMRKRWPCAGASRLILYSMVSTAASAGIRLERRVAAGRVERRGDHAGVQEAVLLGQRLRRGQLDHDPARGRPRPASRRWSSSPPGDRSWRARGRRSPGPWVRSAGRPWRVLLELTFT